MLFQYRFDKIDADYFQFHLQDSGAPKGGLAEAWTGEALAREVAAARLIAGIGTRRKTFVRLDLEIYETRRPAAALENWFRIVECSLEIPSGHLLITSPTLALEESRQIALPAGCYRLRIFFDKPDGKGKHWYKILLWPEEFAPVVVTVPAP